MSKFLSSHNNNYDFFLNKYHRQIRIAYTDLHKIPTTYANSMTTSHFATNSHYKVQQKKTHHQKSNLNKVDNPKLCMYCIAILTVNVADRSTVYISVLATLARRVDEAGGVGCRGVLSGVPGGVRGAGGAVRVRRRVTCTRASHTSSFCVWRNSNIWNRQIVCMMIFYSLL